MYSVLSSHAAFPNLFHHFSIGLWQQPFDWYPGQQFFFFFLELAVFPKQKPHPLGKYSCIKQINKLSSLGFNKLEKKIGAVGHERRGTSSFHKF